MQADIFQIGVFDGGQRFGHAVDERLDANETVCRPRRRLSD